MPIKVNKGAEGFMSFNKRITVRDAYHRAEEYRVEFALDYINDKIEEACKWGRYDVQIDAVNIEKAYGENFEIECDDANKIVTRLKDLGFTASSNHHGYSFSDIYFYISWER